MGDDATNDPERKPGYKNYKLTAAEAAGQKRADQSNWRTKLQASKLKFDDEAKQVYLTELAKHSRKMAAARKAGVAMMTVQRARENDPDFLEAELQAMATYRDRVHETIELVALDGVDEPIVGGQWKDEIVAHKKVYATNVLLAEMRRLDPDYKEKQEIDLNTKASVLVAPADMSPEDWIKQQQAANEAKTKEPGADEK
jgi:hypothetical protein